MMGFNSYGWLMASLLVLPPRQGMRTIGPFVAERFLEIVKCRNRLAKSLGYIDYYDFKV